MPREISRLSINKVNMDGMDDATMDQYYSVDSYENMSTNYDGKHFSLLHLNIRSFNQNSDEFCVFLEQLSVKPDIVVLTETWFSPSYTDELYGYRAHHVYRKDRRGGGVSVFVRENYECSLLPQFSYVGDNLEVCSCVLSVGRKRLVVHGIYRPPDRAMCMFSDEMSNIMSNARPSDDVFIVGDLNFNLMSPNAADLEFINMCSASSFVPLISVPTHVTARHSSCLDHIWYNQLCDVQPGVFNIDITDHYPIFVVFPIRFQTGQSFNKRFRDHGEASLQRLRNRMIAFCSEFSEVIEAGILDVNVLTEQFCNRAYMIYDECCPIRTKSITFNRYMKPWLTTALMRCIKRKHCLYIQYKRGHITSSVYNAFKNCVTSIVRRTKRKYFVARFGAEIKNARETWKIINSLVGKSCTKTIPSEMRSEQGVLTSSESIANNFNEYFSGIASKLDSEMPRTDVSPLDYLGERVANSFYVGPASASDSLSIISTLKNKSCSLFSIPNFVYKFNRDIFSPIITNLFNMSTSTGIFPNILKTARIIPIYKSGEKTLTSNYRPISTLSVISKIFEKLMAKQLISFINSFNILVPCQFGFRENSSTSDAILEFLDKLYGALDRREITISVFLDFSKAFDTVSHSILIRKLDHLGIRGVALDWFKSYLNGRRQYVDVNGCQSSLLDVKFGVPQGSVLGPTLFLLYINDMSKCSDILNFTHFADDTTISYSGDNIDEVATQMNVELMKIVTWLQANRLSLNVGKTSYMLFTDRVVNSMPRIKVAANDICNVSRAKFLGITIDSSLNFKCHIDDITRRISRSIGMINRISSFVPPSAKKKIYYSLVYPRVCYGIVAWGRSGIGNESRMEKVLKRARRAVMYPNNDLDYQSHSFLNFDSIYKYFCSIKFYKVTKINQHPYFKAIFNNLEPVHDHSTRFSQCNKYNKPKYCKTKCQRSFLYQSVGVWNELSQDIRESPTLCVFKRKIKISLYLSQGNLF